MDTKSVKHSKHPKKMKNSKDTGKPEVFVLPPDLLKKLGISIGNVNATQESTTQSKVDPSTEIANNEDLPTSDYNNKLSDSSILETANLMKKSVFLSPSFLPTVANVIPGEIEILSKHIESPVSAIHSAQDNVSIHVSNFEGASLLPEASYTQEACHINDQEKLSCDFTVNGVFTPVSNIEQHEDTYEDTGESFHEGDMQFESVDTPTKENLTGVESRFDDLLDSSHSQKICEPPEILKDLLCVPEMDNVSDIPLHKATSKINIISEETIPLSKLREFKQLQSSNTLTPVPVNTIIGVKVKHETDNSRAVGISEEKSITSLKNTKYSEANEIESNITADNKQTNDVPREIASQGIQTTSSKYSTYENISTLDSENNSTSECHLNLLVNSISEVEDHLENSGISYIGRENWNENNAIREDQTTNLHEKYEENTNLHEKISEESEYVASVNGFDRHDDVANTNEMDFLDNTEFLPHHDQSNFKSQHASCEYIPEKCNDIEEESNSKPTLNSELITCPITIENDVGMIENSTQEKQNISLFKDVGDEPLDNEELINILNASKEVSSSSANNNIKVDKVKEIAAYLKKFAHIYTDKNKIRKALKNDKKESINSNTNIIKSKLCIQGVEKPGGMDICKDNTGECKVLKTYTRRNKVKQSNSSHTHILHKCETNKVAEESARILNTVEITEPCKKQEFCSCFDFGRLAYYDYDDLYEHIHFWQHNTTNCELDLIFAIYRDELIVNNIESGLVEEHKTEENVETSNVCWNIFEDEFSDQEQIKNESVVNTLINPCSNDAFKVTQLNDVIQSENDSIISVTEDQSHMVKKQTSDVNLQTNVEVSGSDIILDSDKCINSDIIANIPVEENKINPNNSSAVVTTVEIAESEIKDLGNTETESIDAENSRECVAENDASDNEELALSEYRKKEPDNFTGKIPEEKQENKDLPTTNKTKVQKRRLTDTTTPQNMKGNDEPSLKKSIKCGVCDNLFSEVDWEQHVTHEHRDITWKAGGCIDLDDPDLLIKLNQRLKNKGVLTCTICDTEKTKLKKFIAHVRNCIKEKIRSTKNKEKPERKSRSTLNEIVTCGVCQKAVKSLRWLEHIGKEHNYLAWQHGEDALILDDEAVVWQHLQNIVRVNGDLICYKCGLKRRRVKLYLAHIETCDGTRISLDDSSISIDVNSSNLEHEDVDTPNVVMCGVCKKEVSSIKWIDHIAEEHNYMAWQDHESPLNLEDEEAVWNHLQQIIREHGGLMCCKCGLTRRRVKLYLTHIETCDGTGVSMDFDPSKAFEVKANTDMTCGVCKQIIASRNWVEHIGRHHNYLAWQDGDTPLDLNDEEAMRLHLQKVIRYNDGLTCYKCGLHRKRAKLYLSHVKTCDGSGNLDDTSINNTSLGNPSKPTDQWYDVPVIVDDRKVLQCGVCSQEVPILEWIQHIGKEHNYLAWHSEEEPLDLDDEAEVKIHLLNISKQIGGLICNSCGKNIKYSKTYQQHIKECTGVVVSLNDSTLNDSTSSVRISSTIKQIKSETVQCGVCKSKVEGSDWLDHIHKAHQYLAWIEGHPPLNVNDSAMIFRHLNDISKIMGGLKCVKCGVRRKYVKTYQQHVDTCDGNVNTNELSLAMMNKDELECAICAARVDPKDWRDHAMKKHYNVAWVVGDIPIDLNSPYAVESYIKEYLHRYNKLVCKVCGISRVSCVGFYAHILTCGKTEEEMEQFKSVCNICHNKYLRIYKSQHMTMHREQEYALERKLLVAKEKELKDEEEEFIEIQPGRRKAAEKAKTVLEKYKASISEGAHQCTKCGFSSEFENELSDHVCIEDQRGEMSDSDESVKLEPCSDDETDESDIDSNISDEEREARENEIKIKRYSDSAASKVIRMPYQVKNINLYMKTSSEEFAKEYLTDEDLFPHWHSCEYEEVPDNEIENYMPPLEESCKVKLDDFKEWKVYKRFESVKEKDTIVMFAGASIQCMSWVPLRAGGEAAQLLALACHRGPDVPRHAFDLRPQGPAALQIWDCGNLISSTPQFVLGLVHDYGTIWAMDWCPSGARDLPDFVPEGNNIHRLGLLATACSNGTAYIFAVPYPASITKQDKRFYKIKPVAELRLTMNKERKGYQATAIRWSMQKKHSHVVVGYADGTTAFYDLNGESPLLRTRENNITVFYPYHDERVQNSCIEDVDMYPSGAARGGGVVCVGSAGGAGMGALQSHVAAARVLFPPHWPGALLAGDDCLVNQSINELEWWGGGRRLGGVRCAAGCAWCGRVAAAALPLLRLLRMHPCFPEVHKLVIGTIQMIPLGNKRKRQNDELAMIVEPISYNDAVKKYGIEYKQITTKDRQTQQKLSATPRDAYPERFPLCDVTAMSFCPTFKLHHKLAIAMHSGLIFINNV